MKVPEIVHIPHRLFPVVVLPGGKALKILEIRVPRTAALTVVGVKFGDTEPHKSIFIFSGKTVKGSAVDIFFRKTDKIIFVQTDKVRDHKGDFLQSPGKFRSEILDLQGGERQAVRTGLGTASTSCFPGPTCPHPHSYLVAQGHDDQPQRGQAAVNGLRFPKAFPLPRAEC